MRYLQLSIILLEHNTRLHLNFNFVNHKLFSYYIIVIISTGNLKQSAQASIQNLGQWY